MSEEQLQKGRAQAANLAKAMNPSLQLLCKIGSAVVHAEELLGPGRHEFDTIALTRILDDPEFKEWRATMDKAGLLPVMRQR